MRCPAQDARSGGFTRKAPVGETVVSRSRHVGPCGEEEDCSATQRPSAYTFDAQAQAGAGRRVARTPAVAATIAKANVVAQLATHRPSAEHIESDITPVASAKEQTGGKCRWSAGAQRNMGRQRRAVRQGARHWATGRPGRSQDTARAHTQKLHASRSGCGGRCGFGDRSNARQEEERCLPHSATGRAPCP